MTLAAARELARRASLDLVEVAPTSVPPVVRILDYGKFKYEQAKKEQEAKKGTKLSGLRQVRFRPKVGEHDLEAKVRNVRKLLAEGDKVKVMVIFRGREISHPEIGWKLLQRLTEMLKDSAAPEKQMASDGKAISITLLPLATVPKPKPVENIDLAATPKEKPEVKVKETQNAKT